MKKKNNEDKIDYIDPLTFAIDAKKLYADQQKVEDEAKLKEEQRVEQARIDNMTHK